MFQASNLDKDYRQLRNAESGRNSLPKEELAPLLSQYQTASPENIDASNVIQPEWVVFNTCICTHACECTHTHTHICVHTYVTTIKEKEAMNLKELRKVHEKV